MLEFLNNTFDIKNEISLPIIISLIVFIIGGLSKVILRSVINLFDRIQTRKSFTNMLEEIVKKCQQQSKNILLFNATLEIEHKGDWRLIYTRVTYLDIIYKQDYSNIFIAFQAKFRWMCNMKVRYKAFHKIWSLIELLKFVESSIIDSFNDFFRNFNNYENRFYNNLDDLRKSNDQFFRPYRGKRILEEDFEDPEVFKYIVSRAKIIKKWESLEEEVRKQRSIIMKMVVIPLFEMNKNKSNIEGSAELNNLLIDIIYEYDQMENLITVNRKIFQSYFWNYKSSAHLLKKTLKIIML